MILRLSLIYLILIFVAYGIVEYLQKSRSDEINIVLKESEKLTKTTYESVLNTYEIVAKKDYNDLISNHKAMNILKEFKVANSENRDILRGELYRLFSKRYEYLKTLNVRQFHFHTTKGESLLRMHKPHLNGDPLIDIRDSIKIANTQFKEVHKFEGGRIFPGFRYLFPIIYNGEHLGSVEYSISFEAVDKMLNTILSYHARHLHLDKRISYEKVFDLYKSYFKESTFKNGHYIENRTLSSISNKISSDKLVSKLNKLVVENKEFNKLFNSYKDFSIPIIDKNESYIINFLSIDDTTNSHAAYLVSYIKEDSLVKIENKYKAFYLLMILALTAITLLVFVVFKQIYKILNQRNMLQSSNESLQYLLNQQQNMVILTNGKTVKFANEKFYNFFGLKNLKEYLQDYSCVNDNFISNGNYFSCDKNENWVDKIKELSQNERIVAMKSYNDEVYIFSVHIASDTKKGLYIINFTDQTATMREHRRLKLKVIKDKLTGAYNREFFELNYRQLIENYKSASYVLGLCLIDIDYFKKINDTYGHDVGDSVLKELVSLVNKNSRSDDILIRWGGEEFVLLLKIKGENDLSKVLEHLRVYVEKHDFEHIGSITCSFGASLYEDDEDISLTIKRADNLLYKAKKNGRNKVEI